MTKKELIKELLGVQDLHKKEDLEKMGKPAVVKIAKDFGITDKPKAKAKDKAVAKTDPKETPKEEPKAEPKEEPEVKFVPFCGEFEFDPKKNSSCNTDCKSDNPEEFAKCQEHFKNKKVEPVTRTPQTPGAGTNAWGRRIGSQAELIEQCLLDKEPMTTKDIAKFADCAEARVRRHYLRLIHKELGDRMDADGNNVADVHITKEGLVYLPCRFPDLKGTSAYIKRTKAA